MWRTSHFYKDVVQSLENAVELVTDFYYNFLLQELRQYINEKYLTDYQQFEQIVVDLENFDFDDAALVKTFREVGFRSYFSLFIQLDYTRMQEIQECINKAKKFFKSVHQIDNKDERLEEYFESFEQVGPFLKHKLNQKELIKTKMLEYVNIENTTSKSQIKQKFEYSENFNSSRHEKEYFDLWPDVLTKQTKSMNTVRFKVDRDENWNISADLNEVDKPAI
ncbi:hypothetical protein [Natranaerobius thermophilus]|uniref:Uncharacterized protein n=1 Tax=Natranaerobius thermophilus (strain ATCC BAA-1301 / DSM 18059 / JW/NM-WN-LF) TaxID=457570 RepID=B2A1R3_NATTJ|nr:hypothetical protein [Natranaerobius thermophilus]ACB86110.1 hypothetical protein Nther_2551 [Natranaerobius thermophilus JW/NM-WN-LF]